MKAKNSICKRCHRLKHVNPVGYCDGCNTIMRADERRPQPARPEPADGLPAAADAVAAPPLTTPTPPSADVDMPTRETLPAPPTEQSVPPG